MKKVLLAVFAFTVIFSSCKKDDVPQYDPEAQLQRDEQVIKDFVATKHIEGVLRHESGLYYVISDPGTGTEAPKGTDKVKVKYTGRLLNGTVFDSNTQGIEFTLNRLIAGWQLGIPLIKKGGKIRLLVPSGYAYGPYSQGVIPANAVLDFDIELLDVTN